MPADMKSMKQPSSLLCKHRANEGRCYFHGAVEDRLLSLAQTAKVNRLSCCTVLRSDDHGVVPLRKWQKKKTSCLVTRYALHPADYTVGNAKDYYNKLLFFFFLLAYDGSRVQESGPQRWRKYEMFTTPSREMKAVSHGPLTLRSRGLDHYCLLLARLQRGEQWVTQMTSFFAVSLTQTDPEDLCLLHSCVFAQGWYCVHCHWLHPYRNGGPLPSPVKCLFSVCWGTNIFCTPPHPRGSCV